MKEVSQAFQMICFDFFLPDQTRKHVCFLLDMVTWSALSDSVALSVLSDMYAVSDMRIGASFLIPQNWRFVKHHRTSTTASS